MSGSNVRLRSPVAKPDYVRFSSAQKFRVQVAHYVRTFLFHLFQVYWHCVQLIFFSGTEEVPTLDGYIQMKLNLEKLRWREKVNERKAQIETLKRRNQMALERRQEKSGYEAKIHSTRPTVRVLKVKLSTTRVLPRWSLFKGTTFDLMYSVPPTAI